MLASLGQVASKLEPTSDDLCYWQGAQGPTFRRVLFASTIPTIGRPVDTASDRACESAAGSVTTNTSGSVYVRSLGFVSVPGIKRPTILLRLLTERTYVQASVRIDEHLRQGFAQGRSEIGS